ncbi:protease secretion system outer membrane protein [Hephaestia caeni]|uniref:Protease secretion system outer membrane protein n=1 Tax=Hephaestia caeni TaxID=645617 RepID=A0A397PJ78_9SPHN|nr:TolC family outer membrane protein [Hephaestia caeni]RIA46204.1 protease secretion system outer membrane protein [Hephaestia caeni]
MKRIAASAVVIALCLISGSALAQTAALGGDGGNSIDFLRAYELALEADPTWLAAQARQRADAQARAIARAGLRPNLNYSYDRARNWSDITEALPNGDVTSNTIYNSYSSSFVLSQPLFNAAAGARYRVGRAQAEAGEFTEERARQALAVRVLQAYSDLLFAIDDLKLAESYVTALDEDLRRVERFVVLGEGTRTDRAEVEAQQHLAAARVLEARDRLRAARNGLRILVGPLPMGDPVSLNERCLPLVGPAEPLDMWRERLLAHNPELAAQRSMVQAAVAQVDQQRAGGLPTVAAFARHRTSDSDGENVIGQHFRTATVGIQVRVPLYSGGGVSASTTQARNALEEARHKLDAAIFELIDDLEKQYSLVEMSPSRIDAYARAASASAERVRATQRSIVGGERTNLDALDAERQRLEAQRDLARARYDYLLGWLSLRWQAGTLDDADITRVGTCFQATRP